MLREYHKKMSATKLKVYQPVWRCIYCGVEPKYRGALGKEHIIPKGLEGTLILPRASCRKCEDRTKKFEQECLQKMFREARSHLNIPAKPRRPKERPTELPIGFAQKGSEKKTLWRNIPIENHPFAVLLPTFAVAGILEGKALTGNATIQGAQIYTEPGFWGKMRHLGANSAYTFFPVGEFFQLLAKIGHSYATAEIGFGRFSPLLIDLIVGDDNNLGHHIGTEKLVAGKTNELHTLSLTSAQSPNGEELIVVNVRLFARLNTPTYHVVVGRPLN